jgi:hypothetical protein
MPGSLPGPLGLAAFSGVKLAGYTLAGVVLRRAYPATRARALTIGLTRAAVGLAVGLLHLVLWANILGRYLSDRYVLPVFFLGLFILRMIIWTFVIWFFCDRSFLDRSRERPGRVVGFAMAGTAFSFLLDAVGIGLAFVTPGQISFC